MLTAKISLICLSLLSNQWASGTWAPKNYPYCLLGWSRSTNKSCHWGKNTFACRVRGQRLARSTLWLPSQKRSVSNKAVKSHHQPSQLTKKSTFSQNQLSETLLSLANAVKRLSSCTTWGIRQSPLRLSRRWRSWNVWNRNWSPIGPRTMSNT